MIGQRLRVARAAAGLSLRGLQQRIDNLVTAQAIGKYERNEAMPGSRVLIALAEALDVSVDYLLGEEAIVLEEPRFRKKQIAARKEEAQVEARAIHLLERYLTVEEMLGLRSVDWDIPVEAPYPLHSLPDAELAARSLRDHWGLGVDPVPSFVELLEERGIKILCFALTDIDGLSALVRRPGRKPVPVVVIKSGVQGERQRFTLAHELAHLVLRVDPTVDSEKAAHRFAGSFLMPAQALWNAIGTRRTSVGLGELFELKRLFGVSVQALTYRCKDLGIFSEGSFRKLFQEFSRRGWRSPPYEEPFALPFEEPKRFERLCYRALAEGVISEARAAELISVSVTELNRRMEEPEAAPHERSRLRYLRADRS